MKSHLGRVMSLHDELADIKADFDSSHAVPSNELLWGIIILISASCSPLDVCLLGSTCA